MRYSLYLLLCLFTLSLSAQDAIVGMQFVEKPFADLLEQAKAEDKIIFIDAYTTWCGPCKMMAAKVFPQEEVGAVYNERFINAKIDMEKGEGPGLAARYSVAAYPTYLFVDGNGDIVHKGIGYIPAEQFLALANVASGPESLGALTKKYDAGERKPEFVLAYAKTLEELMESKKAGEVVSAYLATQEDLSGPEILDMIIDHPGAPGSKTMNYLLANADAAIEKAGSRKFIMNLQKTLVTKYMDDIGVRALPTVDKMIPVYEKYAGPLKERMQSHYEMLLPQQMRQTDEYLAAAGAYYTKYPSNDYVELNSIAWDIFENSEDETLLKKGLEFAKQSVAINANYPNMDTLAWLYKKTGDQENAVKTAKKAIEMAKEMGVDYDETEKILKE
ncbi:MAG: thioredoxin domain-containing protein [Bacteroidota bacterium]